MKALLGLACLCLATPCGAAAATPALEVAADSEAVKAGLDRFLSHNYEPAAYPPQNLKEIELGRLLFFDPRLSNNGAMSCATCHQPSTAWTDRLPRARGLNQRELRRRTPSLLNAYVRLNSYANFFWDGRAKSIDEAALAAIQNPEEMAQPLPAVVRRLRGVPDYVDRFVALYGRSGPSGPNLGRALSAFVESLGPREGPFDSFLRGKDSLSTAATRGFVVFSGKGRCNHCHSATVLTDGRYHDSGLRPSVPQDLGRYEVEPLTQNLRAFRTPSLRNAALTAPYMHDGSLATLREVVDFYDRGGDDPDNREPDMQRLRLSEREKKDLVTFLEEIAPPQEPVVVPLLPPPGP